MGILLTLHSCGGATVYSYGGKTLREFLLALPLAVRPSVYLACFLGRPVSLLTHLLRGATPC